MRDLDSLQLVVRTYRSKMGVVLGLPRLLVTIIRLVLFLRRHNIGHVVSSMESIYQSLVVPLVIPRGVRYTSVIHDANQHPGDEHLLKRIGRVLELRRADEIVTLSRSVTDELCAGGVSAERIKTMFLPAFESTLASAPRALPARDIVVGCFGRLLPYKGIDIFVDSMREIRKVRSDVVGRVVGQGPEDRLRGTSDADLIEWEIGWVPETDVDAVVSGFDVLALTYREASQSGVVAHAWANGIPVVTTPVGGLPEQVAGTGCGVVSASVSAASVASSIVQVIGDEDVYYAMSRASLEAANKYSWEAFVSELSARVGG